jgi:hypothetical protein
MNQPIFICGFPKSGTTLLLSLLDSHPDLLVFPEESKFFQFLKNKKQLTIDLMLTESGAKHIKLQQGDDSERVAAGVRDYSHIDHSNFEQLVLKRWESSNKTNKDLLESLILGFGDNTNQVDKRFWVEKTPHNEKYLSIAEDYWKTIYALYIIRDPRDNFASYRIKRNLDSKSLTLDRYVITWLDSLIHWYRYQLQEPSSLLIQYEELVKSPENILRRICDFLKIEWDDCLFQPTRAGSYWSGNSMHNHNFSSISSSSLGKYKELLTEEEIKSLEAWLGPIMAEHGYLSKSYKHYIRLFYQLLKSLGKSELKDTARIIIRNFQIVSLVSKVNQK